MAEVNFVTGYKWSHVLRLLCLWVGMLSVNPAYVSRKAAYMPTGELQDLPFMTIPPIV
jgi:hypothetical protein